jgi:hypothetical protein
MNAVLPVHRLKWDPLPPNEVGKIAKHVKKEEGREEGKIKIEYFKGENTTDIIQ